MTPEVLTRGGCALIFSGMFAWVVFTRDDGGDREDGRQRYLPYISGQILPIGVVTIFSSELVFLGPESGVQNTLNFCFAVFLHLCLYYLLLTPALPVLRRHISARACAMLWMLPNYLYLAQMGYMRLPAPRWVIRVPLPLVQVLLAVWLAGFAAVMGGKILSHLAVRRRILRDAYPAADPAVLEVWRREIASARFSNPKFKLVVSPEVQTPLSVGLFRRSIRVVLPERAYTPEELELIFRHELIHIGREDAWNKFFFAFCSAMCWFNPLMWIAVRRSAEDLELSCDETVLLDADSGAKRRYADLLLKTAGEDRGFTTCLSASANALRYRLKSVVAPRKKPSGALVVGLTFFLLCMSCGYVALACGESTGAQAIYRSQPPEQYVLGGVDGGDLLCTDEAALHRYLSGLRMERISGNYSFRQEGRSLSLRFDAPEGALFLELSDRFLERIPLYGAMRSTEYFYLPEGVDWEAVNELMAECPVLTVHVTGTEDEYGQDFTASLSYAALAEGEALYERAMEPRHPNGFYGYGANRADLSFNFPLDGDLEVEITPLDGGSGRTVVLKAQDLSLSLPEESARYTVRGAFIGRKGERYEAEFLFEINLR